MVRHYLRALLYGPEAERLRRFALVGTTAAGVQLVLLAGFVEVVGLQYLIGAAIAIEITILLQFVVNNAWTFSESGHVTIRTYLTGFAKTNLVRGTAIPIQLGVLYGIVSQTAIPYLVANIVGIIVSGFYRYWFDSRWTWG